mmetsp:Transcript_7095/g.23708  ORF Transcript_7095/g.23708 Transcript_7095/m.23708 type:complete len:361 (+) Transcript_7095:984-2066(+)
MANDPSLCSRPSANFCALCADAFSACAALNLTSNSLMRTTESETLASAEAMAAFCDASGTPPPNVRHASSSRRCAADARAKIVTLRCASFSAAIDDPSVDNENPKIMPKIVTDPTSATPRMRKTTTMDRDVVVEGDSREDVVIDVGMTSTTDGVDGVVDGADAVAVVTAIGARGAATAVASASASVVDVPACLATILRLRTTAFCLGAVGSSPGTVAPGTCAPPLVVVVVIVVVVVVEVDAEIVVSTERSSSSSSVASEEFDSITLTTGDDGALACVHKRDFISSTDIAVRVSLRYRRTAEDEPDSETARVGVVGVFVSSVVTFTGRVARPSIATSNHARKNFFARIIKYARITSRRCVR